MNQPVRSRLKAAASAFASNAVNGNLRRAQLSFFEAWTAEWAFTVALGIVAFRDGGATAVGLVGLLRMVPAAVVAPLPRHWRTGTPGTSPCLGVYGPRDRHRGGRHRRRPRRPSVDRLRLSRAVDDRGNSLPTRTFRIAPVAVPNRA
jgi:hypothetical protein